MFCLIAYGLLGSITAAADRGEWKGEAENSQINFDRRAAIEATETRRFLCVCGCVWVCGPPLMMMALRISTACIDRQPNNNNNTATATATIIKPNNNYKQLQTNKIQKKKKKTTIV